MARMVQLSPEEVDIELAKVREPNHMTMTWTWPFRKILFLNATFPGITSSDPDHLQKQSFHLIAFLTRRNQGERLPSGKQDIAAVRPECPSPYYGGRPPQGQCVSSSV